MTTAPSLSNLPSGCFAFWPFLGDPNEGKSMAKSKSGKVKSATKSEIYAEISKTTELTRKQVAAVFDALHDLIKRDVGKKGPGVFTLPGLVKIQRVFKPATKEHEGINPFTKEPTIFKAKPARNVVKARPLKNLKDMVN